MHPTRAIRSAMPALALFLIAWTPGCGELNTAVNAAVKRHDRNIIKYGECHVATLTNSLTGTPNPGLTCVGGTRGIPVDERPGFVISCYSKMGFETALRAGGRQRHTGRGIPVRYRFAKNPPAPWKEALWGWNPETRSAMTDSGHTALLLLDGVSKRAPLTFRVGTREATIHFTDGATGAMIDFWERCRALPAGVRIP